MKYKWQIENIVLYFVFPHATYVLLKRVKTGTLKASPPRPSQFCFGRAGMKHHLLRTVMNKTERATGIFLLEVFAQ